MKTATQVAIDTHAGEMLAPLTKVRGADKSGERRLLMLTRYGRLGASSRQRLLLFKQPLQQRRIAVVDNHLLSDSYLQRLYGKESVKPLEIMARYVARALALLCSSRSDIIWLEKEALPWMPECVERLLLARRTLIVDFDDGWHLRYNSGRARWLARLTAGKLEALARRADAVFVANPELLRWARDAGATNVVYIPTVVDTDQYRVLDEPPAPFTVGWIGSPLNLPYLQSIVQPLRRLSAQGARLLAIGAPPGFVLDGVNLEAVPWSEGTEVAQLARCHVGIMPLDNTPWERFKSGYKLIQYMAAGRAVVASPVGVNLEIVRDGQTGFFARTDEEWFRALARLKDDAGLRKRLGLAGRRHCAARYSLDAALEQVTAALSPYWEDAVPTAPDREAA